MIIKLASAISERILSAACIARNEGSDLLTEMLTYRGRRGCGGGASVMAAEAAVARLLLRRPQELPGRPSALRQQGRSHQQAQKADLQRHGRRSPPVHDHCFLSERTRTIATL